MLLGLCSAGNHYRCPAMPVDLKYDTQQCSGHHVMPGHAYVQGMCLNHVLPTWSEANFYVFDLCSFSDVSPTSWFFVYAAQINRSTHTGFLPYIIPPYPNSHSWSHLGPFKSSFSLTHCLCLDHVLDSIVVLDTTLSENATAWNSSLW